MIVGFLIFGHFKLYAHIWMSLNLDKPDYSNGGCFPLQRICIYFYYEPGGKANFITILIPFKCLRLHIGFSGTAPALCCWSNVQSFYHNVDINVAHEILLGLLTAHWSVFNGLFCGRGERDTFLTSCEPSHAIKTTYYASLSCFLEKRLLVSLVSYSTGIGNAH